MEIIRQNPCRYCALSDKIRGKYLPSYKEECKDCKNIKEHRRYLESQRKFFEGEPITSLQELLEQEWVIWHHSAKHIETFKSMQLRMVLRFLDSGSIHKAIRKGEKNNDK